MLGVLIRSIMCFDFILHLLSGNVLLKALLPAVIVVLVTITIILVLLLVCCYCVHRKRKMKSGEHVEVEREMLQRDTSSPGYVCKRFHMFHGYRRGGGHRFLPKFSAPSAGNIFLHPCHSAAKNLCT